MNATRDPALQSCADRALSKCATDMADAADRGDFAACARILNAAVYLGVNKDAATAAFAAEAARRKAAKGGA